MATDHSELGIAMSPAVPAPGSRRTCQPRPLFVDQTAELGGAELSLRDIARHYAATGKVVLFTTGPLVDAMAAVGVHAVHLNAPAAVLELRREAGLGASLAAVWGLGRLVLRLARLGTGYDLFYANTQKAFVASALAGLVARRPVIWHLRDILSPEHFSRSILKLVRHLVRLPHVHVIANSHATARALLALGGKGERLVTIHNGIDPRPWAPIDLATLARLRGELRLGDRPTIGVFGRLAEWKGQHILVEALDELEDVQALIVGEALFGEHAYRARLDTVIERSGHADRIHLAGFRADVPALMQLCDIVVHTSIAPEPFGRVIVEAMLAGRPVIAAAAGGAPEIVDDGRSGMLIPPGDPRALAAAIRRLLDEPRLALQLAEAGRQRALERFGLDAALARIDAYVAEVLAKGRA